MQDHAQDDHVRAGQPVPEQHRECQLDGHGAVGQEVRDEQGVGDGPGELEAEEVVDPQRLAHGGAGVPPRALRLEPHREQVDVADLDLDQPQGPWGSRGM